MKKDSNSLQLSTQDELVKYREEPFAEDPYSVNEYACMYYMMTPIGCYHTDHSTFQDK